MTEPAIKATEESDIPALQKVLQETDLFPSDMLGDMLAPSLAGETDAFWLTCNLDGEAVGFCYTAHEALTDGTWNMLALAVHPKVQRKRLGAKLVRGAEQHLIGLKQRMLIIETSGSEDFALAREFYTQNGFVEEARIRDFWANGDDKIVFRKVLGA
ncbi:MAG: GNAT family N-acetyltransferase [Pseudomonadota bacterium]